MFLPIAGKDYIALSKEVTFAPDESQKIITIPIKDDDIPKEADIYFSVVIIFNRNTIAMSIVTIVDDDDYGELTILGCQLFCTICMVIFEGHIIRD